MYLTDLTIHGFRAFPPEEQSLEFRGDSGIVVGDNGTGKSSVLAAIEFLLTGGMTHLSGPGTGNIDVSTHAPHQWADSEDCYVRGTFETQDGRSGTVERRADDHTDLETIGGDIDADEVNVSQWNDEHLILTRGQLLEFIESPPANRGERLSKLLNLTGVSNRARGFNRIQGYLEDQAELKRSTCERQVEDISSTLDFGVEFPLSDENELALLDSINEKLSALNVDPIDDINELGLAIESVDLIVPEEALDPFYEARTVDRIGEVKDWIGEHRDDIEERLESLAEDLAEIEVTEVDSLLELDLFEAAADVITSGTTICPICGETHDEGYLLGRIHDERDRLSSLRELRSEAQNRRRGLIQDFSNHQREVDELLERLGDGLATGDHSSVEETVERLGEYLEEVESLIDVLDEDLVQESDEGMLVVSQINPEEFTPDWDQIESPTNDILDYVDELEPLEERSEIYGDLVTINNSWETLQEEVDALNHLLGIASNMDRVQELFTETREEVLESLYEEIEDSFNDFYTTIHPDEQNIDLDFNAEGTESVDLEATFEGERDSPLAYHSEGHIDTMGICLFLALRDRLNASGPNLVLLDDIVMSVDKTHRRGVARLMRNYLDEGPQAILATHDEVWGDQLTESNVVPRRNVLEITDWDISTGPMLHVGAWEIIEEYLDGNRPHAAAAHLRRQAEKLGRVAAITLRPSMEYKERYSLADFMYAVSGHIKTVAKGAKTHYEDLSDEWEAAKELDGQRNDLFGDFGLEEMNGMVHYRRDDWGQLGVEDLRDVLEKWIDIDEFLQCDTCNSFLQYDDSGDWCWIQCDCRAVSVGYEAS